MPGTSMAEGLRRVAAAGPFFAVRTAEAPGEGPRAHGYAPLAELGADPGPLRARITTVAGRLGTDELRVGASLVFQGLAARLWSLALGSAVLAGTLPDLSPERLWWHPDRSAPDELWLPGPMPAADPGTSADRLRAAVVDGQLVPLHRAVRSVSPVSGQLLWGNAGSALFGSYRVLRDGCRAQGRTEAADTASALVRELFREPPLHGTGTLAGGTFTRRSCCLYYRVPGGGLCGDCALA
ncbi:(2Fe-2S)-binding protein [Streptomyces sp. bgisy100]|uniref:(2Fe-2S)-binding protein n=1 Tax=Streptomyces sp. bgisy100 TaxID=3413783 RepID=UPI003D750735